MFKKSPAKSPPAVPPEVKKEKPKGKIFKTAVARRFSEFSQQDLPTQSKADGFDAQVYADAVQLVIDRLEAVSQREV